MTFKVEFAFLTISDLGPNSEPSSFSLVPFGAQKFLSAKNKTVERVSSRVRLFGDRDWVYDLVLRALHWFRP